MPRFNRRRRLLALAILLATVVLLAVASPATARPLADPTVTKIAPSPGPDEFLPAPVEACPDRPSDLAPLAACPFDPDTYSLWPGADADAPLWTHCNYDSGDATVPCPHSTETTEAFYIRCDGQVWGVTRYAEDGTNIGDENAALTCPGGYVDLST